MTYAYENLGDDRFQQLCQAILTTVHPEVQCLPVGQPDGGRDALVRQGRPHSRQEAIVYQVKFSRNPGTKDEREVVEELIKTESDKVNKLRKNGLQQYYLMTNVNGTSHYDIGSIDRVNKELSDEFQVPAFCWWRDDLDRRIDANSSIKWSFPEIIRGTDVLQALYEGRFEQDRERRLNTIKAYLSYQYKYDSKLKFKQVDLDKGLVDLFVDVPAVAVGPTEPRERDKWKSRLEINEALEQLMNDDPRRHRYGDEEDRIGAVNALIDEAITTAFPRVVIEGAPGQGKSTITQFLCQLHRMVLLQKTWELGRVPADLRPRSVRLPLRVDLRDYATWLSGRSPFHESDQHAQQLSYPPALESFLAAQIAHQSGGLQFAADDLLAVAKTSALLIVLDGFDEVADISTRNKLVREISDAASRIEGNSISYQIIVTSRPAAFANSPGFPRDEWQYIQILALTRATISQYADKWVAGHSSDSRETSNTVAVLNEKLEYPHVRELARNPMQLAILLALISTQGASLPDKRTILYDRYIDILFNRESEKSRIVRDKRDLLISMHRFLAWKLQVEVETDSNAGNVSEQKLKESLRTYLVENGHDPSLIDNLFVGMVERVVALVSRVQGTFEFEVQPLREYFAARFLYDTAPHIQAGSTKTGSIMDRFEALAKNAYWLNVTRFYCGCYSTGELASLVDGLVTLGQSGNYAGTTYIAKLSVTLLSDYVFSLQPRSVKRIMDFLLEDKTLRLIMSEVLSEGLDTSFVLPDECGRARLLEKSIEKFRKSEKFDTTFTASVLIKGNLGSRDVKKIWAEIKPDLPPVQALQLGGYLGVVESMPADELLELVEAGGPKALRFCMSRERAEILSLRPSLWRTLFEFLLDGNAAWVGFRHASSSSRSSGEETVCLVLNLLGSLVMVSFEEGRFRGRNLLDYGRRFGNSVSKLSQQDPEIVDTGYARFLKDDVKYAAENLATCDVAHSEEYERQVSTLLSALADQFGRRSLVLDAGIAALKWFDAADPQIRFTGLLAELNNIKLKSVSAEWWNLQFDANHNSKIRVMIVKCYLAWIKEDSIAVTIEGLSTMLDEMSVTEFGSVYDASPGRRSSYRAFRRDPLDASLGEHTGAKIGYRAAALVSLVVSDQDKDLLFEKYLESYDGNDPNIVEALVNCSWGFASRNPDAWPAALKTVSRGYEKELNVNLALPSLSHIPLPLDYARAITSAPEYYPLSVVSIAEKSLIEDLGSHVLQVESVAAHEQWFSDD